VEETPDCLQLAFPEDFGKHLDDAGITELRFARTAAEAVDVALAPGAENGQYDRARVPELR